MDLRPPGLSRHSLNCLGYLQTLAQVPRPCVVQAILLNPVSPPLLRHHQYFTFRRGIVWDSQTTAESRLVHITNVVLSEIIFFIASFFRIMSDPGFNVLYSLPLHA